MKRVVGHLAFGAWLVTSTACGVTPKMVSGVTNTQAILTYTAPDDKPCVIEVRASGSRDLVNDVNPALFPGSDRDTRPGGLVKGRARVMVIGKRAAEIASDGKYHSRALEAFRKHVFLIRCGSATLAEGEFETRNIPLGLTYNDPLPSDPNHPGQYAWPSLYSGPRDRPVIDPSTGMRLHRISSPEDGPMVTGGLFRAASDNAPGWMTPEGALRDDGSSAVFSGAGNSWLFLEAEHKAYRGGSHSFPITSPSIMHISLNAWQPADSESRDAEERTIEVCITANGVDCTSAVIEAPLKVCKSGCGDNRYRFAVGDPPPPLTGPPLANWSRGFAVPPFNVNDWHSHSGVVSRKGKTVRYAGGNRFNLKWTKGTLIEIGSSTYRIDHVDHDEELTLISAPFGDEPNQPYKAHASGVLIRRKSPRQGTIFVQSARWDFQESRVPDPWDAGGDGEAFTNCSTQLSPGPGGEQGWHCEVASTIYWIGKDTGAISLIGTAFLPKRDGADGWGGFGTCTGGFWDAKDPNVFYCALLYSRPWMIIKAVYHGANEHTIVGSNGAMVDCGESAAEPCWQIDNLTPPSKKRSLYDLAVAFAPDIKELRATQASLIGLDSPTSDNVGIIFRRGENSNDSIGYITIFNLKTKQFVAAASSYKTWPMRWGSIHGTTQLSEKGWVAAPVHTLRGLVQGDDYQGGAGPFISRITSGAVTTKGEPCPPRPADSPIEAADWPKGDVCLNVTVDGEPADPTPKKYSQGTITIDGKSVSGTGTSFDFIFDGAQLFAGGEFYRFEYLSPTSGKVDRAPAQPVRNAPYAIYQDAVNSPKTGNPAHGYLQDAEIRDIFCGESVPTGSGCYGLYTQFEFFRLIAKSGNNWTLERGYRRRGGRVPFLPMGANAALVITPTSCALTETYPCASASLSWNYEKDPRGANSTGKTLIADINVSGAGHSFTKPAGEINAVSDQCPKVDDLGYSCYNIRLGELPKRLATRQSFQVMLNPAFAGKKGVGEPNFVDSHPGYSQLTAPASERNWFIDARPMFGAHGTGGPNDPGVRLEGNLYRFKPSQVPRLRRKVLSTTAFCGVNPLVDISGPDSVISSDPGQPYRYCVANRKGECRPDSGPGDLFVNCPQINKPYCYYPGIAQFAAELRDICVFDTGAHAQAITQVGFGQPDLEGKYSRVLTHGLTRYRYNDVFWSGRTTPDGKWLIFRTPWADGQRYEALAGKIPPFPQVSSSDPPRNTFVPVPVEVKPVPGATTALVEFGYTPEFYCTSRREACVKGAAKELAFASEDPAPVPCQSGCTIEIPGISHRVMYFRVVQRNAAGKTIKVEDARVEAVP